MKKFLLLAFAACLTFAAQAVTMQWTDQSEGYDAAGTYIKNENTNASVGQYSLAILVTMNSVPSSNLDIIQVQQWASGSVYVKAYGDSGNALYQKIATEKGGSGGTNWFGWNDRGNLPGVGEEALVIFTWEDTAAGLKITSMIKDATWTHTASPGATNLNLIVNSNDAWTVKSVAAYEGLFSEEDIAYMKANGTTIVPEPTALALLALGVAGLALRRKMV